MLSISSESATSIMVSCQVDTLPAVHGKSVIAFIAMAIPITSIGTPSCANTTVNTVLIQEKKSHQLLMALTEAKEEMKAIVEFL